MDKTRTYNHFFNVPEVLEQGVKEDVKKFGTVHVNWMLDVAPIQKMVEIEMKENKSRADIFFQLATNVLYQLSSKDILPPHNVIAREAISETEGIKYEDVKSESVNMLAFEVLKVCNDLKATFMGDHTPLHDEKGYVINELDSNKDLEDLIASKDGMFWMDKILLDYLSNIGKEGKKAKKEISPAWKDRYKSFVDSGKNDMTSAFKIWVAPKDTFHPAYLKLIAEVLYKDIFRERVLFEKGKHPSITRGAYHDVILPPLLGKTTTKRDKENNTAKIYNEGGQEIIVMANMDMVLFESALTGFKKFNSITGHKVLRWQIGTGFNNWIKNQQTKGFDPRRVVIDGGYGKLCEMIGCPNTARYRKTLKSILHAQAYGYFKMPNGIQGNMISLRELEFHRNGEASKLEIIIGGALMPDYTNILANREDRRLIPVPKLPKMVSDTSTHAAQATLQLTVLKEFSDRSPELAKEGAITLSHTRWEEMAKDSGLNPKKVDQVVDGWCEYDFDNQFLDKSGDQFTIATPFEDAKNFILDQGIYRLKKSKENQKRRNLGEAKKKKKERSP